MREEKTFVFEAFQRAWGIAEGQRFFVLGMCVCVLFLFLAEVWGFFLFCMHTFLPLQVYAFVSNTVLTSRLFTNVVTSPIPSPIMLGDAW